jgi:hypothetical protein
VQKTSRTFPGRARREHVNPAELGHHAVDHALDARFTGDVRGDVQCPPFCCTHFLSGTFGRDRIDLGHDDGRALRSEAAHVAQPNSFTATGDDGNFTLKPHANPECRCLSGGFDGRVAIVTGARGTRRRS